MKKVIMFLLLVLYSGVTVPDYLDGNKLLSQCESKINAAKGTCLGYITGVADASHGRTLADAYYCKPKKVSVGQLNKIVTKYLNNNPEKLHLAAFPLVQLALLEAFPCE